MKRTLSSSITAALFLIGGWVQAQALFESPNIAGTVTFFNGDPKSGAVQLAHVPMNNSPVAVTIVGIERATHVTVNVQGTASTFKIVENGVNKNAIFLALPQVADASRLGHDGHASLTELFDTVLSDPTLLARLESSALAGQ